MTATQNSSKRAWIAFALLLIPVFVRAMTVVEPMPYWDTDVFAGYVPSTGRTPMLDLLLDGASLIGLLFACAAAFGAHQGSKRTGFGLPFGLPGAACFLLGGLGVAFHAGILEDRLMGISWIAAISTGVGVAILASNRQMRGIILSIALGFIGMLFARSMVQVLVDHPMTIASFEASREAIFASRGWEPDSSAALQFERRLLQNDASAWFALSNVLGGIAAWSAAVFVAISLGAFQSKDFRRLALCITMVLASGTLVVLTNSKGAIATAMLGSAIAIVFGYFGQTDRWRTRAAWIVLLAFLVPVTAVIGRGIVGEASAELSLLFRSQYLEGTAAIVAHDPLTGVGPSGFQDAYLIQKPSISPEDVSSPHNLIAAWIATLGLAGVGWVVVLLGGAMRAARSNEDPSDRQPAIGRSRATLLAIVAVACGATFAGAMVEAEATTPEAAIARVLGLLSWIGVSWALLGTLAAVTPKTRWIAGIAGTAAIASHLMLDVSGVFVSSASLVFLMIAVGVTGIPSTCRIRARVAGGLVGLGGVLGLVLAGVSVLQVVPWQSHLRHASEIARPVAEARADMELNPVDWSPRARRALQDAERAEMPRAIEILERASQARHTHLPTRQALDRLLIRAADASAVLGTAQSQRDARAWLDRAAEESALFAETSPSAGAWGWAATVHARHAQTTGDAESLARVPVFLEKAAELDPHGLTFPFRLFEFYDAAGDLRAKVWAARAMEAHERLRLDPTRQLNPQDLGRVDAAAAG